MAGAAPKKGKVAEKKGQTFGEMREDMSKMKEEFVELCAEPAKKGFGLAGDNSLAEMGQEFSAVCSELDKNLALLDELCEDDEDDEAEDEAEEAAKAELAEEQIAQMRQLFSQLDPAGSGKASAEQMIEVYGSMGAAHSEERKQEIRDWVQNVDTTGSGAASVEEFLAWLQMDKYLGSEMSVFKQFDKLNYEEFVKEFIIH
ncbi:uncharacterized protein [Branchiostoma lanceolatum]|uniref:uncharacterized protein isoform X2 n=1 Tax=Branchiostoma lanceolatum TaxID=7740 RepID=UPI0034520669